MPSAKHILMSKHIKYITRENIIIGSDFPINFLKLIIFVILFSLLLASCNDESPNSKMIGFWKSTNSERLTVVEIGKDYFVYYAAPTQMLNAKKKGPIKVEYKRVADELQGLERTMNVPEIRIKNNNGDKTHIQVSSFKDTFVRIGADEAKNLMAN